MFVSVQIPDEVYQKYAERQPERPQLALAATLKEFAGEDPAKRRIILEEEQIREVNAALGVPVENTDHLLSVLHRAGRVSFGDGLEIELPTEMRLRLEAQAAFLRHPGDDPKASFAEFVRERVTRALWGMV